MFKSKPFPHRPDKTKLRNRRRSGQAIVENVFTLLPTFALIFAFIDFGLTLFRWSTLQNAVREGVRFAVTFQQSSNPSGGNFGQDRSIMNVVEAASLGLVNATQVPQKIFVKYYNPNGGSGWQTNPIAVGASPAGNVPNNIVEVSVQNVSWQTFMPISGTLPDATGGGTQRSTTPLAIYVYSSDILGGFPPGVTSVTR